MLNYELSESKKISNTQNNLDNKNIVLIHGLFGDKDNLNILKRAINEYVNVLSIDLPNHGGSPHIDNWQFSEIADLFHELFTHLNFSPTAIIGHSLGGKVAMSYALTHPDNVKTIIVADIAPVKYQSRHDRVFEALNAVSNAQVSSRKDALEILDNKLNEPGVAQFLLKSFKNHSGKWDWKFNLSGLQRDYQSIIDWPFKDEKFDGKVHFIKGQHSDYITEQHAAPISHHFSNTEFKVMGGTGHWLHAEKPELFNRLVLRIIDNIEP